MSCPNIKIYICCKIPHNCSLSYLCLKISKGVNYDQFEYVLIDNICEILFLLGNQN